MRVLVTGATGFVGSCLVRRLVGLGCEVHIFVRSTSNRWRILDLLDEVVEHEVDLQDHTAVESAVMQVRPAVVYHLATYGGFADQRDTAMIVAANFLGTVHLLRACERVGFDMFINTGSSSEYGIKPSPMKESDLPEPLGDYGVTKVAASQFCRSEALQKGLPVVTLRLFSPYGPWDDPKRFMPYLLASLLRGESPRLSTPASVRDYVHIDDVVDLYLKVAHTPGLSGKIINVGSGVQHSLGELVSLAKAAVGCDIEPQWGATAVKRSEPKSWVADIGKARTLLGWEPARDFSDGLRQTVGWLRGHLDLYP
jgi:nucleoside-diphosphate-sugar epimerase